MMAELEKTNGIPHPTSMPLLSKEEDALTESQRQRKEMYLHEVDNPVPQRPPGGSSPRDNPVLLDVAQNTDEFATASDKLVILMVGLPARGKTFIAQKLLRYLSFFHAVNVKVFNIGEYRRQKFGHFRSADWFDPEHEEGTKARKECADAALEDLKHWVAAGNDGRVAVLDGTHSTLDKRQYAQNFLAPLACKVRLPVFFCFARSLVFSSSSRSTRARRHLSFTRRSSRGASPSRFARPAAVRQWSHTKITTKAS